MLILSCQWKDRPKCLIDMRCVKTYLVEWMCHWEGLYWFWAKIEAMIARSGHELWASQVRESTRCCNFLWVWDGSLLWISIKCEVGVACACLVCVELGKILKEMFRPRKCKKCPMKSRHSLFHAWSEKPQKFNSHAFFVMKKLVNFLTIWPNRSGLKTNPAPSNLPPGQGQISICPFDRLAGIENAFRCIFEAHSLFKFLFYSINLREVVYIPRYIGGSKSIKNPVKIDGALGNGFNPIYLKIEVALSNQ